MNVQEARALASAINQAADRAEALGMHEVALGDELRAADDKARAELEAAIARAQARAQGRE